MILELSLDTCWFLSLAPKLIAYRPTPLAGKVYLAYIAFLVPCVLALAPPSFQTLSPWAWLLEVSFASLLGLLAWVQALLKLIPSLINCSLVPKEFTSGSLWCPFYSVTSEIQTASCMWVAAHRPPSLHVVVFVGVLYLHQNFTSPKILFPFSK